MHGRAWPPEDIERLRVLRCVEGRDFPEIAWLMGRGAQSVKSQCNVRRFRLPLARYREIFRRAAARRNETRPRPVTPGAEAIAPCVSSQDLPPAASACRRSFRRGG